MGYLIAPRLDNDQWMCLEPCDHTDCAAMRRDWIENGKCKICGEQIEAGDKFYYQEVGSTDKTHFACELMAVK